MSLVKLAIESGLRTDLPNAWKVKKGMGPNGNIPIAKGLFKQALEIPVSHLKGDAKEINEMRRLAKKIIKITKDMNKEDNEAMK
jgi:hypothetical protein